MLPHFSGMVTCHSCHHHHIAVRNQPGAGCMLQAHRLAALHALRLTARSPTCLPFINLHIYSIQLLLQSHASTKTRAYCHTLSDVINNDLSFCLSQPNVPCCCNSWLRKLLRCWAPSVPFFVAALSSCCCVVDELCRLS